MRRTMQNVTESAKSAVCDAGRPREYSNVLDILQGVARGCTLSPNLFKVYTDDMIAAIAAANQMVTVWEDVGVDVCG